MAGTGIAGDHPLVMHFTEDGFVDSEGWVPDGPVTIDPRDETLTQALISRGTVGATDVRLDIGRVLPGMYHIKHHHPSGSEIYYFIKGSCVVHLDGEDIIATPGTAIYIPANCVHAMRNDGEEVAELVVVCSNGEYGAMGLVYDE